MGIFYYVTCKIKWLIDETLKVSPHNGNWRNTDELISTHIKFEFLIHGLIYVTKWKLNLEQAKKRQLKIQEIC